MGEPEDETDAGDGVAEAMVGAGGAATEPPDGGGSTGVDEDLEQGIAEAVEGDGGTMPG